MKALLILVATGGVIFFLYEMLKAAQAVPVLGSSLPVTIPQGVTSQPNPFARPI